MVKIVWNKMFKILGHLPYIALKKHWHRNVTILKSGQGRVEGGTV